MEKLELITQLLGIIVEKSDFEIILKENGLDYVNTNVSIEQLKESRDILSINQRITLFSYAYLYYEISSEFAQNNKLEVLLNVLLLPKSLLKNCSAVFTEERVAYIKKNLKNKVNIFCNIDSFVNDIITNIVLMPLAEEKKILKGLNAHNYEHPVDKAALEKLRLNSALEKLIKIFSEYDVERLLKIQYTGSLVRVTRNNIPYVYEIVEEACQILDMEEMPPLYLEQGFINAFTVGVSEPIIVLSNATLSLLSRDELLFIIGHELGHIKSQHILYHSIGSYLPYIGNMLGNFTLGIGDILSNGIELALYNWQRMSEFTADRAGLLACQNVNAAISVMYKLAGYPTNCYNKINVEDFIKQADSFEDLDSSRYNKILKVLSAAYSSHPWTVMRAKELKKWVDNKEYIKIVNKDKSGITLCCKHCGAFMAETAKFCSKCGEKIE